MVSRVECLQSHFICTMSHWSSGLTLCFPSQGTWVLIPGGVFMWNRDAPVSDVSLHSNPYALPGDSRNVWAIFPESINLNWTYSILNFHTYNVVMFINVFLCLLMIMLHQTVQWDRPFKRNFHTSSRKAGHLLVRSSWHCQADKSRLCFTD